MGCSINALLLLLLLIIVYLLCYHIIANTSIHLLPINTVSVMLNVNSDLNSKLTSRHV